MKEAFKREKVDISAVWSKDRFIRTANKIARLRAASGNLWAPPDDIIPRKELLYMSVGIPDSGELPKTELNKCMQEVFSSGDDSSFRYGFGPGYYPIRKYLAEKYTRERGVAVTPDWFLLTNGSSAAIDLIVRSMIDPGDVIMCETPTYMGSLSNFQGVGAEVCPVGMDDEGLDVSELKNKIQHLKKEGKRIKLIYTISTFQNPSGLAMGPERKTRLMEIAAEEKIIILDDDAYGDLYYGTRPFAAISSLGGGLGVLTVGTFSKVLATGLRIGWVHAHPDALNLFMRMKFDMGQNQMAQHMMGRFLENGYLDPHVEKMRKIYKEKMNITADFIENNLSGYLDFRRPSGGFYLWAKLKKNLSAKSVWRTATQEGVAVNQGFTFIPNYKIGDGEYLRIAYSWTPMQQLEEALNRLKTAVLRVSNDTAA